MDATEVTEVCRLCPSSGGGKDLLHVLDKTISFKYNIKEVILMNTGIEILENDLISKKICQRCCNILYKMYEFRLDAVRQDQKLKDKCGQLLGDKGIRLPNTCVTIKKEKLDSSLANRKIKTEPERTLPLATPSTSKPLTPSTSKPLIPSTSKPLIPSTSKPVIPSTSKPVIPSTSKPLIPSTSKLVTPSTSKEGIKIILHPSVADVFKTYPHYKLPKKCFERHIAPVVSLAMGEVETHFKKQKLNMKKFIYKPKTKTELPQKITKTSVPTTQKTVTPLKISKKLLENLKEQEKTTDNSSTCSSAPKVSKGRKRKSTDSDRSITLKLPRNNQPNSVSVPETNMETPKPIINKPSEIVIQPPVSTLSEETPGTSRLVGTPSPTPADQTSDGSRASSPAPADPISEDSRDSSSTNISEVATSSADRPQFMESFGLTPAVTTTKSHTLLVCSLCGSVHHNAFELKRHIIKHMLCQFCKLKFKSVEAKENHVDHSCRIKKVMNSSGLVVDLEKIHLNLDVRKKYSNAFASFEWIPGLQEPTPVEQVILEAPSPSPSDTGDGVIVLSDDEEAPATSPDPLSGIPTPSMNMPPPAAENLMNFMYSTVSIVRPDIRIKNNTILNSLVENMTDKQLLKELILLFKPQETTLVEKMIQTDLPASKDIKINNAEGTCEFRNLKGQLATYKIPITISNGAFHVGYQFKGNPKENKGLALWDDLPVIDGSKKTASKPQSENTSTTSSLVETSQVKSLVVSSVPVKTNVTTYSAVTPLSATTVPTVPSVVTKSSSLVTVLNSRFDHQQVGNQTTYILNNNITPINTSNSATPLLQNYALSMTSAPVISNPIPIPRTYINSALSNTTTTSNRAMSSAIGNNVVSRPLSSVIASNNRSLPTSKSNNISVMNSPQNIPSFSTFINQSLNKPANSFLPNLPSFTTITPVAAAAAAAAVSTSTTTTTAAAAAAASTSAAPTEIHSASTLGKSPISTPPVSETSKFRVKSVWELQ